MARPRMDNSLRRDTAISLRASEDMADEFKVAAIVIGTKMSDELHRHMVEVIRRAKAIDPARFEELLNSVRSERIKRQQEPSTASKPARKAASKKAAIKPARKATSKK